MTLTEIKEEIPLLTLAEKLKLMRWLATDVDEEAGGEAGEDDAWDLQMREDCKPGGKLDALCKKADAEYARGETEKWP